MALGSRGGNTLWQKGVAERNHSGHGTQQVERGKEEGSTGKTNPGKVTVFSDPTPPALPHLPVVTLESI